MTYKLPTHKITRRQFLRRGLALAAGAALAPLLRPLDGMVHAATGPIIIDHTSVDRYVDIPQEYINEVKKMWLDVPGESHSVGYRYGVKLLENIDSRFQVNVLESGTPEGYTDQYLRVSRGNLWRCGQRQRLAIWLRRGRLVYQRFGDYAY